MARKFGKKNEVKIDPLKYNICLLGEPKIGKDVYKRQVWYCKSLQNHKALLSTNISDGMYYELTYNGDKNELYLDAYKKWQNVKINLNEEE